MQSVVSFILQGQVFGALVMLHSVTLAMPTSNFSLLSSKEMTYVTAKNDMA